MKMNTLIKSLLCISVIGLISCSGNEPTYEFSIQDPEGTRIVTLPNDASEYIQLGDYHITMDQNNNFICPDGLVAFYCYGRTDYLQSMDTLFPSGWRKAIAILPQYGYAVRLNKGTDGYARIIITDYTEDDKGVSGATIKYQYPWHPRNEETIVYSETEHPEYPSGIEQDPGNKDLEDCDNTVNKCFEINFIDGNSSSTSHIWCTEYSLVSWLKDYLRENNVKCTYSETEIQSEETCFQMDWNNPEENPSTGEYNNFWNNSTWHFVGTMECDGSGEQEFTITFHDVNLKTYSSNLYTKYWLATTLKWEDYGGWRVTLRGYDDGGHTSFDFDFVDQNTVTCEYHHWDKDHDFCKANFIGTRIQ